ncbi:hypothetical protein BX616_010268 [Lobosporangium transversale]|uniref:Fcf2 pre-rRNA processing-domain-containing protein n=1 Tax=Lobosporangium transversale TaxID=64571 RepID=A0A1Y2GA35_9FUNG|nr:Fcf2 pre-rRNA processing-domain-containing protein [Lobosporangium transversale]KAF9912661.1 hypothetical protein BX616_010268 [Lobosporangium transversale]ORZ05294.1 Fcf2 pre-rRNA processing-domain-containing protein [Lobosporangium transversale]|eukprot:XP_021876986.1 Fcf2 pre-rRNA processing-domain-containing protein [Lobosporangium transversale]
MVTTRNGSKNAIASRAQPQELSLPTRSRRTRQTKAKTKELLAVEGEGSETVESSSPTSSPDSGSPLQDAIDYPLIDDQSTERTCVPILEEIGHEGEEAEDERNHSMDKKSDIQSKVCIIKAGIEEHEPDNAEEGEDDDDGESDEENEEEDDDEKENAEEAEEEEEDLDQLLARAQESLKRKAMFEEKTEEQQFNFPKLETGLNTNNTYFKQDGAKVKVDKNTVVVVENGTAASKPKAQSALETCEINMNAHKVHVSKKQKQEEREKTTGKGWFDLPQQVLTPELKRDLQILKLRNVLDPKRFYKREDKSKAKFPKYFQVGTIIEGNTEFYSSRLTKKERATTITGEVMKDLTGRDYYKRKFNEIQEAKQSGGKRFYKKGKGKQSKSWRAGK